MKAFVSLIYWRCTDALLAGRTRVDFRFLKLRVSVGGNANSLASLTPMVTRFETGGLVRFKSAQKAKVYRREMVSTLEVDGIM